MKIQIYLEDFIEWRYDDNDENYDRIIEPLKKQITNLKDLVPAITSYLPFELIKNIKEVNNYFELSKKEMKDKEITLLYNCEIKWL